MTLHPAKKVVIVTEKIISKGVCEIIEKCGGTGYTIVAAAGKGSRNIRSTTDRAVVINDLTNLKVEVLVHDEEIAQNIMESVAKKYFSNYSGITYVENVQILRPEKFLQK